MHMGLFEENISKYLHYLEKEGWSDLIDERWKEDVRKSLIDHFPEMKEKEWRRMETVLFVE